MKPRSAGEFKRWAAVLLVWSREHKMSSIGVRLVEVMFVLLACLFVNTANAEIVQHLFCKSLQAIPLG